MAQDPRALLQKVGNYQFSESSPALICPSLRLLTDMSLQADKTISGASGGFSFFGGRQDKYQDAVDLYIQAANAFRMQNLSAPPQNPRDCLATRPGPNQSV